jgi:hypothetical protein
MKEPNEDFLEQIKNALFDHEEPYEEGAWERFAAKNINTKKPVVISIGKWALAAAAVLAGVVLMVQYFTIHNIEKPTNTTIPVVQNTNTQKDSVPNNQNILIDSSKKQIAIIPQNNSNKNNRQTPPYNAFAKTINQKQSNPTKTNNEPIAPTPPIAQNQETKNQPS